MRTYRLWIMAMLACVAWGSAFAHVPDHYRRPAKTNKVKFRDVCANSESQIDQEINNVRARLLGGGDCWWDFDDGRYIVPKVDVSTGQQEVSSIFAGSVWLGGIDPAGNLKLACQDYRPGGDNDFWPGPLNEVGLTTSDTCDNWDRHFKVTGEEIRKHLGNLAAGNLNEADIPRGVKGWPARGNIYFRGVWGFNLPFTSQALAGFFDVDEDGLYEPLEGDYPSIEIRKCPLNQYPDEMIFWIYNDQGGGAEHARTMGSPIQMEVQVQSFSYVTNDELNDMTFQRYKLINRAIDRIDSMFFAMWVDPDLGCYTDDYIGCDTAANLMYVYNQDPLDGTTGCTCDQGVPTYCDKIPMLGVDYFRGPLDTFGNEIGMSSFTYYNNGSVGNPPPGTTDPDLPAEFYNYLTGTWKDGSPFQFGGDAYQEGDAPEIDYAFVEPPNSGGWTMCTENLPFGDRRTIQASGPFTLKPGAVNELIIGVPWVPDVGSCPDLEKLLRADKLAQGLFDNCFELLDGPDAPIANWIELNQEIVAVLTNDEISNNYKEGYNEIDFLAPDSLRKAESPWFATPEEIESTRYKFEGYKIYQLANPNVSNAEFETDPDKSRLVYQVDIKNGISSIYNWAEVRDPNNLSNIIYFPEIQVQGENKGIRHTFSIKDDKFATGNDRRLINHKKYYFAVIAYAYNNWGTFDPLTRPVPGQQRPYLPGRRGPDGLQIKIVTVIPRPTIDMALRASYGDGVVVTRLEGAGNGGNFIDLDDDTRAALFAGTLTDTALTYRPGRGPINVTIFNPFEVKDGDYELRLVDGNLSDTKLDDTARWELRQLPGGEVIVSEKTISEINEQIVLQYGFSVNVNQQAKPGALTQDETNGAIGAETEFANPDQPWLIGFPDQELGIFHYVKTRALERDAGFDPNQALSTLGNGWFVPYPLCDWDVQAGFPLITPAWTDKGAAGFLNPTALGSNPVQRREKINAVPSVDIVFTSDKSKWSRCLVVETASRAYTFNGNANEAYPQDPSLETESPANRERVSLDVRYAPSVGKDDNDGDGLPDPDGAVAPVGATDAGQPLRGMGWFPGYAIDVETGQRLNIFFGENSCYTNNRAQNGTFNFDLGKWGAAAGWEWSSGAAMHTPGSETALEQTVAGLTPNRSFQFKMNVSGMSAGNLTVTLGNGPALNIGANGPFAADLTSANGTMLVIKPSADFNGTVDNIELNIPGASFTGRDMLFNPTDQVFRDENPSGYFDLLMGGQHFVYVANTPYDSCEQLRRRFTPELSPSLGTAGQFKVSQVRTISWAGMLQVTPGFQMKSLRDGLIPSDVVVKLRVDRPYQTWYADDNLTNPANGKPWTVGHPKYQFKIGDREPLALQGIQIANALDSIKVVPNPYYGFSQYETSQFSNTVKITNLPGVCTVTIYSLDGKFIRQYQRNESYAPYSQISPAIEWDLKNNKGIPVASGVYLIQVQAPGLGERTVKWFGVARQFDPSGL